MGGHVLLLAHRGDHARAPENSLAAFRAALARAGCDGVEMDIRGAADGSPIVLHDPTLARVQGVSRRASGMAPAELGRLGVPTLADVLSLCPPAAFLDLELKEAPSAATLAPVRTARGAPDGGLARAVLSSFEPGHLEAVRALEPGWPCWLNVAGALDAGVIETAVSLGCAGISADWRLVDRATAAAVRAAGLDLAAWTVRRGPTLARLAVLGVVAACVEGRALPV